MADKKPFHETIVESLINNVNNMLNSDKYVNNARETLAFKERIEEITDLVKVTEIPDGHRSYTTSTLLKQAGRLWAEQYPISAQRIEDAAKAIGKDTKTNDPVPSTVNPDHDKYYNHE